MENNYKRCSKCNSTKPLILFDLDKSKSDGHKSWCKGCCAELKRKLRYKLEAITYNTLLEEQGEVCAICLDPTTKGKLCVDHSHFTGKVRGLLCDRCNRSLGALQESADICNNMVNYIKKHGG